MKLWTSLMFLHGHIADPALAIELAKDEAQPAGQAPLPTRRRSTPARAARSGRSPLARLLHEFEFLGGRPMTAGHNDDIEEPFPQPARAKKRASPASRRRAAAVAACTAALSPFR